jgi:hypothetical protein
VQPVVAPPDGGDEVTQPARDARQEVQLVLAPALLKC